MTLNEFFKELRDAIRATMATRTKSEYLIEGSLWFDVPCSPLCFCPINLVYAHKTGNWDRGNVSAMCDNFLGLKDQDLSAIMEAADNAAGSPGARYVRKRLLDIYRRTPRAAR